MRTAWASRRSRGDGREGFGVKAAEKGRRRCIVVVPKQPAAGNPWSWRGCYWDHEPQTEVELLRRGFHVAFITPDPGKEWDAWYAFLTEKHGLSRKAVFVGMSKGGVNDYEWTAAHPDRVAGIYADNPAIRPGDFAKLGEFARNDVALLNVCGSQDFLLERHTLAIESRYHQLGGRITVMIKDGAAHHPHSLRDPQPIADWIVKQALSRGDRPAFADASFIKSSYYGIEHSYRYLKEEKTYADCRGPAFTRLLRSLRLQDHSQWGLSGMAVIVPKNAAPGKPWVFRAHRDRPRCHRRSSVVGQGFSHRGRSACGASGAGAETMGCDVQVRRRPRLFEEAGAGRRGDGGGGSLCLGH